MFYGDQKQLCAPEMNTSCAFLRLHIKITHIKDKEDIHDFKNLLRVLPMIKPNNTPISIAAPIAKYQMVTLVDSGQRGCNVHAIAPKTAAVQ